MTGAETMLTSAEVDGRRIEPGCVLDGSLRGLSVNLGVERRQREGSELHPSVLGCVVG